MSSNPTSSAPPLTQFLNHHYVADPPSEIGKRQVPLNNQLPQLPHIPGLSPPAGNQSPKELARSSLTPRPEIFITAPINLQLLGAQDQHSRARYLPTPHALLESVSQLENRRQQSSPLIVNSTWTNTALDKGAVSSLTIIEDNNDLRQISAQINIGIQESPTSKYIRTGIWPPHSTINTEGTTQPGASAKSYRQVCPVPTSTPQNRQVEQSHRHGCHQCHQTFSRRCDLK